MAGTQLYVVGPEDDVDAVKEEAMEDVKGVMARVDRSGEGVCVQVGGKRERVCVGERRGWKGWRARSDCNEGREGRRWVEVGVGMRIVIVLKEMPAKCLYLFLLSKHDP